MSLKNFVIFRALNYKLKITDFTVLAEITNFSEFLTLLYKFGI